MTQCTRRNFASLIPKVAQFIGQPAVYVTSGQVVGSIGENIPGQNFNHVKACGSVMHALKQGEQTIYVRTVDTEVVVVISLLAYSMIWLRVNIWSTSEWSLA